MKTGLVSITFRKLSPQEIVELVVRSGLHGIEWGGDVHVPHGDTDAAHAVRDMTVEAGLEVSSYGSYYRASVSEQEGLSFNNVLNTTLAIGAPVVRVWAGKKGSADAEPAYRTAVAADLARIGAMAADKGVTVCCEYHGGTLTDTNESAALLMKETSNVRLYWQPDFKTDFEERLEGLKANLGFIENFHVFCWHFTDEGKMERKPLEAGAEEWRKYFAVAASGHEKRWALIEFVRDDSTEQFLADAESLKKLCMEIS